MRLRPKNVFLSPRAMKQVIYTTQFRRDLKKAQKAQRDTETLKVVMRCLIDGQKLTEKYRDHKLIGNYRGRRECHVGPDFLLIYKLSQDAIVFERLGSHSELFD